MDPQFEELAQRLSKELSIAVTGGIASAHEELGKRITEELSGAERRLTSEYTLHSESLKEEVKLAAEGYGATLEAIRRELHGTADTMGHSNQRP